MPLDKPETEQRDEAARKIQWAFRKYWYSHKSSPDVYWDKILKTLKIELSIEEWETWAETADPEVVRYINLGSLKRNPNSKLYYPFNTPKTKELCEILQTIGEDSDKWNSAIFEDVNLTFYAFRAFHRKLIDAFQRSTVNQLYWAIKEFGREQIKTYRLFTDTMEFSEEANFFLKDFFHGALIKLAPETLKAKMKDVKASEQYFTTIDITAYYQKTNHYDMFHILSFNGITPLTKSNNKVFNSMIHTGAWDALVRHLCETEFTFEARLGCFTEDDIAKDQQGPLFKRLTDEKIVGRESLTEAHNSELTRREAAMHDSEYHTVLVACFPEAVRNFILGVIRPLYFVIENHFPALDYKLQKARAADLEDDGFYNMKFNKGPLYRLEDFIKKELKELPYSHRINEHSLIIFLTFLMSHQSLFPEAWKEVDFDWQKIIGDFRFSDIKLLRSVIQETLRTHNMTNLDDSRAPVILLESALKYLLQQIKDRKFSTGDADSIISILDVMPDNFVHKKQQLTKQIDSLKCGSSDTGIYRQTKQEILDNIIKYLASYLSNSIQHSELPNTMQDSESSNTMQFKCSIS